MKRNIVIFAGIAVIVAWVFLSTPEETTNNKEVANTVTNEVVDTTANEVTNTAPNETANTKPEVQSPTPINKMEESKQPAIAEEVMANTGSYEAYGAEKIARAATGDVVLFFHASWCPSCRALSSDIEKNASAIPAGVTILKMDYDAETELKKKYGVTYQHTLVQVDKDGNLITKWSGGSKLENLLSKIQ